MQYQQPERIGKKMGRNPGNEEEKKRLERWEISQIIDRRGSFFAE